MGVKTTIGIISDTHDIVHPDVFEAFENVDQIWHAGDIGHEDVISELSSIAPVMAVHGNSDTFPVVSTFPNEKIIQFNSLNFYLVHKFMSHRFERIVDTDWKEDINYHAIIFGHTHQPLIHRANGVLYFNPGSCRYPRYSKTKTVGLLTIDEKNRIQPEIIPLS